MGVLREGMLSDVQAVVFDLDGTLLDRRRSFEQFVRGQWKRFAHFLKAVDREQYVRALIEGDRGGLLHGRSCLPAPSRGSSCRLPWLRLC